MNKGFKVGLFILIILYLLLYFSYRNGYYIDKNREKSLLTEEMIKEYEEDLKNGVDISQKEYVVLKNNYDNNYTRASLKIANRIENMFDGVIKYVFNHVGRAINE